MAFIKAGFTGGFIGIVLSVLDIFVNSRFIEKLSSVGLYVASYFGKVCVNTNDFECSLIEKFTTLIAILVGNCIAYFILFALASLGISLIKMWFVSSKSKALEKQVTLQPSVEPIRPQTQVLENVQQVQQAVVEPKVLEVEQPTSQVTLPVKVRLEKRKIKESRPKKKAKISKKSRG